MLEHATHSELKELEAVVEEIITDMVVEFLEKAYVDIELLEEL